MDKNKIKGIARGVPLGDALGSPVEFNFSKINFFTGIFHNEWKSKRTNQYGWTCEAAEPGTCTDDTEMTLANCHALLETFEHKTILKWYHNFANSETHSLGKNTRFLLHGYKTLSKYYSKFNEKFDSPAKFDSVESNGFLMRISPLSLITNVELRHKFVESTVNITNPGVICTQVAILYVDILNFIIQDENEKKNTIELQKELRKIVEKYQEQFDEVVVIKYALCDSLQEVFKRDVKTNIGWALHALSISLWILLNANSFQEGIEWVIRRGGDTDTNGAIAGALLGGLFGEQSMMSESKTEMNIKIIDECNPIISSGNNNRQKRTPRPSYFHPKLLPNLMCQIFDKYKTQTLTEKTIESLKHPSIEKLMKIKHLDKLGALIGISGASQSGKTTLTINLKNMTNAHTNDSTAVSVHQDDYWTKTKRAAQKQNIRNYENYERTDWEKMINELKHKQKYHSIVIVEGFLIFENAIIRDLLDKIIWINSTEEQGCKRRKQFVKSEHCKSPEEYYKKCVWPAHIEYTKKTSTISKDLHISEEGSIEDRSELVFEQLKQWNIVG